MVVSDGSPAEDGDRGLAPMSSWAGVLPVAHLVSRDNVEGAADGDKADAAVDSALPAVGDFDFDAAFRFFSIIMGDSSITISSPLPR